MPKIINSRPKKSHKTTKTTKSTTTPETIITPQSNRLRSHLSSKLARHPKPSSPLATYSREKLERELKIDAKALGIPSGAAEIFIERTLDAVEQSLRTKTNISDRELTSAIAKELKKYHADFAYVYQNRGKII